MLLFRSEVRRKLKRPQIPKGSHGARDILYHKGIPKDPSA